MPSKPIRSAVQGLNLLLIAVLACNLPGEISFTATPSNAGTPQPGPAASLSPSLETLPASTLTPTVTHLKTPGEPGKGKIVYDCESQSTALEKRAPGCEWYDWNWLERSFQQDMTYVSDLDIYSYTVASDTDWWYVSFDLMGTNPNNAMGINFGVELDLNHDGFGDFLVLGDSTSTNTWDTAPVQIFQDKNHDTAGLSGERSDAPITTDGYETSIFPGGADPDMAWMRLTQDGPQFAFKKSWSGVVFMLGVFADAGLKDPKKLDYVDRFEEAEAGSPIKGKPNYPLKALFLVDNVCREAFGFNPSGEEPQLCPREAPPPKPKNTPEACELLPDDCPGGCVINLELCTCGC